MTKNVFITGAAQGIGLAIARYFYQHGYKVGIFDLNLAKAQSVATQLGERAYAGYLDVVDSQQWQMAIQQFVHWSGGLNILVNNAGILFSGNFEDTSIEQHHSTVDVNIKGVLNGCYTALPYLRQHQAARIINLSSAAAIYGQADLISYSATKFAVRGLTEGLDVEWAKYGIRVLDVMPLFVNTDMVTDMDAATIQKLGIHLQAEDVAKEVFQLASTRYPLLATHRLVGLQSKIMFQLSKFSPQLLNRWGNVFLSKKQNTPV